jgi:hypothetical protein
MESVCQTPPKHAADETVEAALQQGGQESGNDGSLMNLRRCVAIRGVRRRAGKRGWEAEEDDSRIDRGGGRRQTATNKRVASGNGSARRVEWRSP